MIREGLSFFIPTKKNGVARATNFNRTNELTQDDNCIALDELNKSDYLFETIILFIIKKIKEQKNDNKRLYKLINDIESLATKIYLSEIKEFDTFFHNNDESYVDEDYILSESNRIASLCMEERIFDYE